MSACPSRCGHEGPTRLVELVGLAVHICPGCLYTGFDGKAVLDPRVGVDLVTALRPIYQAILRENSTDPLTKTRNRRFFIQRLVSEADRARHRHYLSLAAFVIEAEEVCRRHGARGWRAALEGVAAQLMASAREGDNLGRVRDSVFALIVPKADIKTARQAAERIAARVEGTEYGLGNGSTARVGVRVGVIQVDDDDPEGAIDRAIEEAGGELLHVHQ